jgi:uncharacterized membrane protein YiaA
MSFGIYLAGFAVLTLGLLYGAHLLHVPGPWIFFGALVLLGIGVLSGVRNTRQKDPPA